MGTSTSRRSPPTTRFGAFRAALGVAPVRAVSELYTATASEWQKELAGAPVAPFADAAWRAYEGLASSLSEGEAVHTVISEVVTAARNAAVHQSGGNLAVALGERALARLLLSTLGTASGRPEDAATAWTERRGESPEALVRGLVTEVARQLAVHVASRDVAQLVSKDRTARDARELVREVAEGAATVAAEISQSSSFTQATVRSDWAEAISAVFEAGRNQRRNAGA